MPVVKILGGYLEIEGGGVGAGQPPGIWGGGNQPFPTPPIHLPPQGGGQPPGIWGGSNEPFPGYGPLPGGPGGGGGGGNPPGIWGGSNEPFPGYGPLPGGGGGRPGGPPSIWPGRPAHPIVIPPEQVAPPQEPVHPGDPTTPVPPPAGQDGWPVQPMEPPAYIVVYYPGVGPVYVAPPMQAQPSHT